MKHLLFIVVTFLTHHLVYAQAGMWTWMKGDSIVGSTPVFGTQGVADNANTPPGLYSYYFWAEEDGTAWVYGGLYDDRSNVLWKFDPVTVQWTWMHGSSTTLMEPAVYGVQGIPSPSNTPGWRGWGSLNWRDQNGNLWLYSGRGDELPADLWKYDPTTNEWTWMTGDSVWTAPAYDTFQGASAANTPGFREECNAQWIDGNGDFWFYGGQVNNDVFEDLWKFDVGLNQWVWMGGTGIDNLPPSYGTMGIFSLSNTPGSRSSYSAWKDENGKFWLFGGGQHSINTYFNDVWAYDPIINQWAWMGGTMNINSNDQAGNPCDSSTNYHSSSKYENRAMVQDDCGNIWLFGGMKKLGGNSGNDLWLYASGLNIWSLISGQMPAVGSFYGTQGVNQPANLPKARSGARMWKDASGNFWLFGGSEGSQQIESLNDLWKFTPDLTCGAYQACPTAAFFSASDTVLCEKFCIDYFDQSVNNPISWEWVFEGADPASSTDQNPADICYDNPGLFDVTLITTGSNGNTDTLTLSDFITVYSNPFAPVISQNGNMLTSSAADNYQWQLDGVDIPGATNQSYEITQSGLYTVIVYDENGCSAQSDIQATLVGVVEVISGNLNIYPNPSQGFLHIDWSFNESHPGSFYISNFLGQEIYLEQKIPDQQNIQLDLSGLSNGIYYLHIKTEKSLFLQKIIISK